MKKFILPIFILFISFLVLPTFAYPANAQPKNITCAEWKNILGTDKCKYAVVTSTVIWGASNPRSAPPNSIWCSNTVDITDTFINLPVDYEYTTSDEQCIYDVVVNHDPQLKTNNAEKSTGSQQSTVTQTKELEEPAGRGIGEFIRKIQNLRLNPFDKPQDQVGSTEQKTPGQTVNDWIVENIGVYEPKAAIVNETPLQNREPQVRSDKPPADSPVRQMVEEELAAGGIISNYDDGVLIESLYRGSWVYISPSGVVRYSPELGRRVFEVRSGEVEVKTEETTIEVETPDATIKSKGTHYWVAYDPNRKSTTVGIYEGEVVVTPKGGEPISIVPDGNNPGIVVVSQKLSVVKLVTIGATAAVIIGGPAWLIHKKKTKRRR